MSTESRASAHPDVREHRRRRHRRVARNERSGSRLQAAAWTLCAAIAVLPLLMGHRTPATLSASLFTLVLLAAAAAAFALWSGEIEPPSRRWLLFAGAMTAMVLLHVLPLPLLGRLFGPYPDALYEFPGLALNHWSPDPGASLRGWAAFAGLFAVAWLGRALPGPLRHRVLLAIVGMALFQAVYGLLSHASGAETIFGIWERNNPDWVHGSYSNRNLFAAYLALTWPLAVGIWFVRGVPGLGRLPLELRATGAVLCGAILGAAMLGSGSRLGSAAGLFGILLALLLWGRHRRMIHGASAWPAYIAAAGALVAATWYGLTPLAERLLATTGEESRLEVFAIMLTEFPLTWWLHGVGLGGFEAVFKQFQPGDIRGWYDYAHNDLLQWGIETGLPGLLLLGAVAWTLIKRFRMNTERIALYAGLAALCLVGLGDFSWHIPGTQVVLAFYVGSLVR